MYERKDYLCKYFRYQSYFQKHRKFQKYFKFEEPQAKGN